MNPAAATAPIAYRQRRWDLPKLIFYLFCGLILLFLIAPLFIVVPISFSSARYLEFPPRDFSLQWYRNFFGSGEWTRGAVNSLQIAAMASLLSSLLGIPTAMALTRYRFKGRQALQSLLIAPMITPVIIIAIAVYFFFANLHMIGGVIPLVISHTMLAIPVVLVTVSASLQGLDLSLEQAAMSLGANRWKTFLLVTFPLIRPGVISGALFAFITSFDEVVIAIFVSTYRCLTLPKHMWSAMRQEIDPTIAAASSLLVALSMLIIFLVAFMQKRRSRMVER